MVVRTANNDHGVATEPSIVGAVQPVSPRIEAHCGAAVRYTDSPYNGIGRSVDDGDGTAVVAVPVCAVDLVV